MKNIKLNTQAKKRIFSSPVTRDNNSSHMHRRKLILLSVYFYITQHEYFYHTHIRQYIYIYTNYMTHHQNLLIIILLFVIITTVTTPYWDFTDPFYRESMSFCIVFTYFNVSCTISCFCFFHSPGFNTSVWSYS